MAMVSSLEFRARTRLVTGGGCVVQRLPDELLALGVDTIALVVDRGFADAGLLDPLIAPVRDVDLPMCALVGVDPDVREAEAAAQTAIDHGAQAVLAIGGGSALCVAKAVAIRLHNPAPLDAYEGRDRLPRPPAPTIAIPTTAGSGSEVSTVVVLHDPRRAQHLVIRGRGYEPDVALLDGTLLRTLPPAPLVHAALDALSHALEALWSRKATRFTDALALAAAGAIREALPGALARDEAAMQALIEASAMANLACGNAEMGIVHALTSAPDVHLPHGYQNGVLLPHVAAYNRPVLDGRAAEEAARVDDLYREIGFEAGFAAGELSADDAGLMVSAALGNPFLANNRRAAGADELRALLASAGAPL
jgi:alcohol dehydrogenase class IV